MVHVYGGVWGGGGVGICVCVCVQCTHESPYFRITIIFYRHSCMIRVPTAMLYIKFPFSASPQADMVLCSILDRLQPQWIVNYHEHDSLLEHVFDEELTEEERKAAWEKYKADMAAESVQYNYQALQNRLEAIAK